MKKNILAMSVVTMMVAMTSCRNAEAVQSSMMDPAKQVAIYLGTHVKGCQYVYHRIHPEIINMVYEALGI